MKYQFVKIYDINALSATDLRRFISHGFAYVKLPDSSVKHTLYKLHDHALKFYNAPLSIKNDKAIQLNPDKYEGYIDRRRDNNPIFHEQGFFRPHHPIKPFSSASESISTVHEVFWNKIAQPLIRQIFSLVLRDIKCTDNDYVF